MQRWLYSRHACALTHSIGDQFDDPVRDVHHHHHQHDFRAAIFHLFKALRQVVDAVVGGQWFSALDQLHSGLQTILLEGRAELPDLRVCVVDIVITTQIRVSETKLPLTFVYMYAMYVYVS